MTAPYPSSPQSYPGPALPGPGGPAGFPAPQPGVPGPPQGPGAQPPFPAPPVEGRSRRIGMGIGIGAGTVVLVAGVGIAAVIGLTAVATRALNEQVDAVVGDYLDALHDERYEDAYDALCQSSRGQVTEQSFTDNARRQEQIASYDIGELQVTDLSVPVHVRYESGGSGELTAYLEQNSTTGGFEVCNIRE